MQINNVDIVIYTFQFVVPGYIIGEIIAAISPQRHFSEGEKCLRSIGLSVCNTAIWYWLFLFLAQHLSSASPWYWSINALATVITGAATGIILGLIKKKNVVRWIFNKCKVDFIDPIPNAWDYKFSDGNAYWVEITTSNEKVIRGLYSSSSMTSSDSEFRDIYLEELYTKSESGWEKAERTAGVWVHPDEIHYIKFYSMEE